MRQYIKTQCLDTIDVLNEAHAEITNLIEHKQYDAAIDLLGQCQHGAISIGNTIEESEGDGTDEVHQLEHYCEMVYRLSEDIASGSPVNIKNISKSFRKNLIRVANGIRNNLSTQREVVFMPYKAAMWDSLESVWKEMDSDPDVTAIVIPIPYYDKNPDGSFKEIHYEFDKFPKEVPIMGYRNYDLAERHPDAIYIHNPYDNVNIVTSVHPDFYSSKLKEYTDELVYIPYYILGNVSPDNKEAVKNHEHFITVPGVYNAHRVIVQSENWRKIYIDVLTRHTGEENRKYWEEKIEASVSPKVTRVANLTASDFVIPDEWKALVEREDGSRKKIIFYNTSVGALLQERDTMLEKIGRVFETFKENKDDVTLLWRPHPLIEATLTAMVPKLWYKYKQMVDAYKNGGWGIYDDSPEIDRAIAISDAYYGDWSSVVWMYKETGKPIMIQDCGI